MPRPYKFKPTTINDKALDQTEFWYDRAAKLHRVDQMNKFHCLGAMNKLLDQFGPRVFLTPLFKALQSAAESQ